MVGSQDAEVKRAFVQKEEAESVLAWRIFDFHNGVRCSVSGNII